jgi:DNA primase
MDDATKLKLRRSVSIVDAIGERVALTKDGEKYTALCPWHTNDDTRLMVNPHRQSWNCLKCNIGGCVINFIMRFDNRDYLDVFRELEENYKRENRN